MGGWIAAPIDEMSVVPLVTEGSFDGQFLSDVTSDRYMIRHYGMRVVDIYEEDRRASAATVATLKQQIESMLFDNECVGGLMPSTADAARKALDDAGGPSSWDRSSLGYTDGK